MIRIVHPACQIPAEFKHIDAAIAFLQAMAGKIQASEFVAAVVATSGPDYADLARNFIAGCLGAAI